MNSRFPRRIGETISRMKDCQIVDILNITFLEVEAEGILLS